MSAHGRLPASAIALLAALLLAPAAVLAADPIATEGSEAMIAPAGVELQAQPAKDGAWQVKAQVVDSAGVPVAGTEVRFSVAVQFLGPRRIFLGSAPTDVTGRAAFVYRPTWNGVHSLIAEVGEEDGGAVVAGQLAVDVESVTAPIAPDPVALPTVRTLAVPLAALLVASVWAVLGLVFLMAVVGIWRARPQRRGRLEVSLQGSIPRRAGAAVDAGKQ